MKYIITCLLISTTLIIKSDANLIENNLKNINKTLHEEEQRNIFEKQNTEKKSIHENKTYIMEEIKVEDDKIEESCIEIEKILVKNSTIFDQDDFEDIISPYLNNCNGIKNLQNLINKISNMYIEKGYITSRAYLKGQDLSDGEVDISVLEGKIEKVEDKRINSSNIYNSYDGRILNIRDLEVSIQQAERLRSQSVNLKLLPGKKQGYTIVHIIGQKVAEPYYGDISLNNFGNDKTGKYQISGSFNYENLFDLSDIFTIRLNSTDNVTQSSDNTMGNSLSYSIPYGRSLFNIDYSFSKYDQVNLDEFGDSYKSDGKTHSASLGVNYKLFHTKNHNVELLGGFSHKKSDNFLNDVKLEIQSYKLSVFNLGIKHTYSSNTYSYYSIFNIYKGLDLLGAKNSFANQESDFLKYVLDLNYTKYFQTKYKTKYNFSLRGQYSKNRLFGTEEISMGGPYSVRGFKEVGLSGNTGFYVRNELSNSYNINKIVLSPYLGLDYGYILEDEGNVDGFIVGSALGLRSKYLFHNLDFFYTNDLKESDKIEGQNKNFFGFKYSYDF